MFCIRTIVELLPIILIIKLSFDEYIYILVMKFVLKNGIKNLLYNYNFYLSTIIYI